MKGAIFDVDGTLLDSMSAWDTVTDQFFKRHHIPLDDATAKSFQEMTLEESIPIIRRLCGISDTSEEEILAEFMTMIEDAYRVHLPLKEGAGEYVRRLHEQGVKIAIATSGFHSLCEAAFDRTGILSYIDTIVTSSQVGVNKSNPDIYLLAARRLGLAPGDCTAYEDITAGIIGAKKAGMKTVAIYDASNMDGAQELKALADRYIVSWNELLGKDEPQ